METVERHYAPFVPALRERMRRIMETGSGLEAVGPSMAPSKYCVVSCSHFVIIVFFSTLGFL